MSDDVPFSQGWMMGKLKAETKKTPETPVFDGKNHGFRLDVPLDQSIDLWKETSLLCNG